MKVRYTPGRGKRQPNGKDVHREEESEGSLRQNAGLTVRKRLEAGGTDEKVAANRRVMSNAGAGGSDLIPIGGLRDYLKEWPMSRSPI